MSKNQRAFISAQRVKGGFIADVISEQDFHERGPFAHSYRTAICARQDQAEADAKEWAEENGYYIYHVDDIA